MHDVYPVHMHSLERVGSTLTPSHRVCPLGTPWQYTRGLAAVERMAEEGIEADAAIHNALINLHGRCAGYAAARRALADMTAAGAVPDVVSFFQPRFVAPRRARVEVRLGLGSGLALGRVGSGVWHQWRVCAAQRTNMALTALSSDGGWDVVLTCMHAWALLLHLCMDGIIYVSISAV